MTKRRLAIRAFLLVCLLLLLGAWVVSHFCGIYTGYGGDDWVVELSASRGQIVLFHSRGDTLFKLGFLVGTMPLGPNGMWESTSVLGFLWYHPSFPPPDTLFVCGVPFWCPVGLTLLLLLLHCWYSRRHPKTAPAFPLDPPPVSPTV